MSRWKRPVRCFKQPVSKVLWLPFPRGHIVWHHMSRLSREFHVPRDERGAICGGNLRAQVIAACPLRASLQATRALRQAARVGPIHELPEAARVQPTAKRMA